MDFSGKHVVVTGAGTGIGAATAKMFLDQGAEVTAVQRVVTAPHATTRVHVDLTSAESIVAGCREMPDTIDVLCNIAGVSMDGSAPASIIGTNYIGTRMLTELLLERIPATGCVINTSSTAGRYWRREIDHARRLLAVTAFEDIQPLWDTLGLDDEQSYHLAKQTVVVWTMKMASQHAASGPRFNVVSPGFTLTPMLQRALDSGNELVRQLALSNSRMSQPEEVAPVYLFLASDEARVVNGVELPADAGLMATLNCRDFEF